MNATFNLPDLGEGLSEAEIVAWHVSEGDHVTADQPLVAVETDKAVVEVPSPRNGTIAHLLAQPGERVAVGAALVAFAESVEADHGSVVGELPQELATDAAVHRKPTRPRTPRDAPTKAVPAARRLAKEKGVDLKSVSGTGPGSVITQEDVQRAATTVGPSGDRLRGTRRAMSVRMASAGRAVVPATVNDDADVSTWPPSTDPMVHLVAAVVAACRAEPSLNAWFDDEREQRTMHEHVDIGIAVDTPEGLFAPVLRHADEMLTDQVRLELDRLRQAALARKLTPDEFRNPTLTLSNFGVIAGRYAALVIVPPQVAIVGAGAMREAAQVKDGKVVVGRVLPLSLTFDHRTVTGGEAARFLKALIAHLENANQP